MKNKRLLIVKVNPIVVPPDKQEELRKKLVKQLKDGLLMVDKANEVYCIDYDAKQFELRVISQGDKVVTEKKN